MQIRDDGPREVEVRRRSNTRAKLLDAAVGVFAARGARRVTVDGLVAAAGYTRGAFYSNFSSIDELLLEAFKEQSQAMLVTLRAGTFATAGHPRVSASELIESMFAALAPIELAWYALHAEVSLLCLRDADARATAAAMTTQLDEQLAALTEQVLDILGRTAIVPTATLGKIAVALYLHSLGICAIEPDATRAHDLVNDVLPRLIESLSIPREA